MEAGLKNKYGPWVSGEDFFNRDTEVRRLTELIDDGNNILVVAPRRVGKTSLIRETFRRMEERNRDYLLFVDVQHCSTPEDVIVATSLVACPYQALKDKIFDVFSSFWKQFRENVESIGSGELLEIKFREGLGGDWQAKGQKILGNLAQADRPIAICFDELPIMLTRLLSRLNEKEYETKQNSADVFLTWLRHLMGEHQDKLRFIVCGSIGLEPILKRHGLSHTITQLRAFPLQPWSHETAEACLNALALRYDLKWANEAQRSLLDHLGSYIPHHVQMFFGHLYEDCRRRSSNLLSPEDVKRIYQTSMLSTRGHAELADYEERLLRVLDRDSVTLALDLLTETAVAGILEPQTARLLAQSLLLKNSDAVLREVLDILQHDGYLEWDEHKKAWLFASFLMKDWWKKRFSQSYVPPQERR